MRTGILLFLAVLSLSVSGMLLTGCSSTSVKRVDVDETIDLSGQWNDTDSRLVAEEMIGDVLSRTWVRFVAGHPEFVRIMHDEGKHDGPRLRWLVDRHVRPLYEGIGALLEHRDVEQDVADAGADVLRVGPIGKIVPL